MWGAVGESFHHGIVLGEEAFGKFYFVTLVVITWVFALQLFVKQYLYVICTL